MKRAEFLREMTGSLFKTVKSVYEPFAVEDLEKVEAAADQVLGITWVPFMRKSDGNAELEMKFLGGKPIIASNFQTNMQAMDGVCPVCSNIIILTTLFSTGKCLNCQKEFNFKTQSGDLQLLYYPLKLKEDLYFIGLQKQKKPGDLHA